MPSILSLTCCYVYIFVVTMLFLLLSLWPQRDLSFHNKIFHILIYFSSCFDYWIICLWKLMFRYYSVLFNQVCLRACMWIPVMWELHWRTFPPVRWLHALMSQIPVQAVTFVWSCLSIRLVSVVSIAPALVSSLIRPSSSVVIISIVTICSCENTDHDTPSCHSVCNSTSWRGWDEYEIIMKLVVVCVSAHSTLTLSSSLNYGLFHTNIVNWWVN